MEVALGATDANDLRTVANINLVLGETLGPLAEDLFAGPRFEAHRTAQRENIGLSHDVLALLVLLDGVRMCCRLLEQYMRYANLSRTGGCTQPARPRPYYRNCDLRRHLNRRLQTPDTASCRRRRKSSAR